MLRIFLFTILFFSVLSANAAHKYPEKYYQNQWCSKWHGISEYKLIDGTRVDCLTKNYAVEFDFAQKWAESIGQSLHYARMTGKNPAIILIIEKTSDFKYYNRIKPLCEKYSIALWYMQTPDYKKENNFDYTREDMYFELMDSIIKYAKDFLNTVLGIKV